MLSTRRRYAEEVRPGLTCALGVALAATSLSSLAAFATAPTWAGFLWHLLISVPCLYFLCICVHDGVHGVLLRSSRASQLLSFLLSLVIALPFPLLQHAHLKHHRRIGHDDDPEAVVYGVGFTRLLLRLPLIPLFYARSFRELRPLAQALCVVHVVVVAAFFTGVAVGGGAVVALTWAASLLLAIPYFGLTTVWVPHGPSRARLMPWLRAHSGWHDDHHRDARYPFHQYAALRAFHLRADAEDGFEVECDPVVAFWARPLWGRHHG